MISTIAPQSRTRGRTALTSGSESDSKFWSKDWMFAAFSVAMWAFAPFLRRVFDWETGGFHALDILSLLPLLSILPLFAFCFRAPALERVPHALKVFLGIWTLTLLYGVGVAAIAGNFGGSLYEFAQYEFPAIFGLWLAGQSLDTDLALRRLVTIMMLIGIGTAVYGIAQWISPAPWDVEWIEQSGLENMGRPDPFSLRIFSTLNSAGPAADFFAMSVLFALPVLRIRNVLALIAVPLLAACLMLTLVRTAWVGIVIGFLFYLLASPTRLKILPFVGAFVLFVVVLAGSLPTLLGDGYNANAIISRVETFSDVEHDGSANDRAYEYRDALDSASKLPQGLGLGAFGPAARLSGSVDVDQLGKVLDGGYLARLLSLGWIGFLLYVIVVAGIPVYLLFAALRDARVRTADAGSILALGVAVGAYLVWDDFGGDSHLSIAGLMFWIASAIAFRASTTHAKMVEA